jgi:MarR family transcriptional regulator, 2-MHQ and catechol-resistance regulon repressor
MDATRSPAATDERLTTVGLLFESAAGLRRLFHRRAEASTGQANLGFDILIRLARTEGHELRMSELAAQASLTPSGLTRAVDRLQQQGFVTRRSCPEDRRGSFAQLTDEGQALMERVIPEHLAEIDRALDDLYTPEEEAQLAALLRRLRDYALEQNLALGIPCEGDTAGGPDPGACPDA